MSLAKGQTNLGSFASGREPHNKGVESIDKLKKVEAFEKGLPIVCKKHGEHLRWRKHTGNNVQCLHCGADWQRAQRDRNPIKFLLSDARQHAKKKGISFDLQESDIVGLIEKQNGKCALSGIQFDRLENKFSLDKINPNGDYTIENTQLVVFDVNRMKTNLDQERFIYLCNLISSFSKGDK